MRGGMAAVRKMLLGERGLGLGGDRKKFRGLKVGLSRELMAA